MTRRAGPLTYRIALHSWLDDQARLSLEGDYTSLPFPTPLDAEQHARREAAGRPLTIERATFRAPGIRT